ncbi:MAG: hypothetical protein Q8M03_06260 [Legionella sp.]|nr:hypothetical protein [Legionella sp.]
MHQRGQALFFAIKRQKARLAPLTCSVEMVKVYVQFVLHSDLKIELQIDLLQPKFQEVPCLLLALIGSGDSDEKTRVIRGFVDEIMDSNLSIEVKNLILQKIILKYLDKKDKLLFCRMCHIQIEEQVEDLTSETHIPKL